MRIGLIRLIVTIALGLGDPAWGYAASPSKAFHQLVDSDWQWRIKNLPEFATALGLKDGQDRWNDRSLRGARQKRDHSREMLSKLTKISSTLLPDADQLNYELFKRIHIAQTMEVLKAGVRRKRMHARWSLERIPAQIRIEIVTDPEASSFYAPFKIMPDEIPAAEKARLRDLAKLAIRTHIVPSYRVFLDFFEKKYLPHARAKVGIDGWSDGREVYQKGITLYTGSTLTPEKIHELGLREVARIQKSMNELAAEMGFSGGLKEFILWIQGNPNHYFKSASTI